MGAPSRMAATPPTTTKATSCRARALRMSRKRSSPATSEDPDAVDEALRHFQPLLGAEREHPEDQAVVVVHGIRGRVLGRRLFETRRFGLAVVSLHGHHPSMQGRNARSPATSSRRTLEVPAP